MDANKQLVTTIKQVLYQRENLVDKIQNYFSSKDHSHIVADTKEPQSQNVNDIWLKEL